MLEKNGIMVSSYLRDEASTHILCVCVEIDCTRVNKTTVRNEDAVCLGAEEKVNYRCPCWQAA